MADTSKELYKQRSSNRVRLIFVNGIPRDIVESCKPFDEIINKYDKDIIRAMTDNRKIDKLDGESLIYTERDETVEWLFLRNIQNVTNVHLVLALAKYPKAQFVMFYTDLDRARKQTVNILDTNLDELNCEDMRENKNTGQKRKYSETIDAQQILDEFKESILSLNHSDKLRK